MSKTQKRSDFDHIAWAKAGSRKVRQCVTCRDYPHILGIIHDVVMMMREKKTNRSVKDLYDLLTSKEREYNYGLKITALRKHITNCLGGLHGGPESK
jgi:hypothetical protein